MHAALAVLETAAHLHVLTEQGVLSRSDLDGVERYHPA
jgi:hypothetical protein